MVQRGVASGGPASVSPWVVLAHYRHDAGFLSLFPSEAHQKRRQRKRGRCGEGVRDVEGKPLGRIPEAYGGFVRRRKHGACRAGAITPQSHDMHKHEHIPKHQHYNSYLHIAPGVQDGSGRLDLPELFPVICGLVKLLQQMACPRRTRPSPERSRCTHLSPRPSRGDIHLLCAAATRHLLFGTRAPRNGLKRVPAVDAQAAEIASKEGANTRNMLTPSELEELGMVMAKTEAVVAEHFPPPVWERLKAEAADRGRWRFGYSDDEKKLVKWWLQASSSAVAGPTADDITQFLCKQLALHLAELGAKTARGLTEPHAPATDCVHPQGRAWPTAQGTTHTHMPVSTVSTVPRHLRLWIRSSSTTWLCVWERWFPQRSRLWWRRRRWRRRSRRLRG